MKTKLNFKQSINAGFMAAITASVINAVLFFTLHAVGVFTDNIEIQPGQALTIVPVLISSIVPTLIASLVFFLLEKYSANGFKIFTIIAIVLGLISFMNPFMGIPHVTTGFAIALNLMHVVVVVSLLFFIQRAIKLQA